MKRLLALFFSFALITQFFTPTVVAQTVSPSPMQMIPGRVNSDVPQNLGTHTQVVLIEVMAALSCQLTGIDPVNPSSKCLGVDQHTGKIGFVENGGGAVGVMGSAIAWTFNIPISSGEYIKYTASNFGIAKSAHAQTGIGFDSLNPLMKAWVAFRNVVYVLFVMIFMLIGFGIIFRFKIDPRTVMTIQNSIPRAIIVLILVTFSFAIAGLLIDIMYLSMYLFYEIIASIEGVSIAGLNPTNLQGSTPFGAAGGLGGIGGLAKNSASGIGNIISSVFDGGAGQMIGALVFGIIGGFAGSAIPIVGNLLGAGLGAFVGSFIGNEAMGIVGGVIAYLIIMVALLWALFRLWFIMLKSYVYILIDTVLAPIWIAGSLIPGSPLTAGSWFKHIFKYISVFPVTFFMFLLGGALVDIFSSGGSNYFTPPFVGNSLNPKHFGSLIGLAIILMTPEVINMIQDALKAPQVGYAKAIGAAFGKGASVAGAPVGATWSRAWAYDKEGNAEGWLNKRVLKRASYSRLPGAQRVANALLNRPGASRSTPLTPEQVAQRRLQEADALRRLSAERRRANPPNNNGGNP